MRKEGWGWSASRCRLSLNPVLKKKKRKKEEIDLEKLNIWFLTLIPFFPLQI
jgi:hypothetical protein